MHWKRRKLYHLTQQFYEAQLQNVNTPDEAPGIRIRAVQCFLWFVTYCFLIVCVNVQKLYTEHEHMKCDLLIMNKIAGFIIIDVAKSSTDISACVYAPMRDLQR